MQVYDVTPFLDDHPGGDEVLVTATGNYHFILVSFTPLTLCNQNNRHRKLINKETEKIIDMS